MKVGNRLGWLIVTSPGSCEFSSVMELSGSGDRNHRSRGTDRSDHSADESSGSQGLIRDDYQLLRKWESERTLFERFRRMQREFASTVDGHSSEAPGRYFKAIQIGMSNEFQEFEDGGEQSVFFRKRSPLAEFPIAD